MVNSLKNDCELQPLSQSMTDDVINVKADTTHFNKPSFIFLNNLHEVYVVSCLEENVCFTTSVSVRISLGSMTCFYGTLWSQALLSVTPQHHQPSDP